MSKKVIETKINRVINSLMAHPDNEPNSEFADMIDNLIEAKKLVKNLTLLPVSKCNCETPDPNEEWIDSRIKRLCYNCMKYI